MAQPVGIEREVRRGGNPRDLPGLLADDADKDQGRRPARFCPKQTLVLIGAIWLYNDLDNIIANSRKQTVLHFFLDATLKTVAYLRVSTRSQDLANQKLAILEFSQKRRFPIDQFIESRISSRKSPLERRIDEMLGTLQPGDRLLVSELSRLGRSLGQVIQIVETLVRRRIRFIAIKEAIEFDGKQDLRTKVMIALFGLFAEVERDLISERTKEGLAAAKAKGKRLGRPKGALGKSRLDGKEQDIRALLGKDVSKASIAKILDVSRSALYHFIETRKIAPG